MFRNLRNTQFTTKLFVAIVFISLASVTIIAANAIRLSREGLAQFGQTAVANTHQAVFRSVLMYDKSVLKNLENDIRLFKREVGIKGDVELITADGLVKT